MSTAMPPAADVASTSTSAPASAPSTRRTGSATPVDVSFCGQAYASTPTSARAVGALPYWLRSSVRSPRNGAPRVSSSPGTVRMLEVRGSAAAVRRRCGTAMGPGLAGSTRRGWCPSAWTPPRSASWRARSDRVVGVPGYRRRRVSIPREAGVSVRWYSVVVDCADVAAQARWWAGVLDWKIIYEAPDEIVIVPPHALTKGD